MMRTRSLSNAMTFIAAASATPLNASSNDSTQRPPEPSSQTDQTRCRRPNCNNALATNNETRPTWATYSTYPTPTGLNQAVDRDFPNEIIDCAVFPSAFGPVPVSWAGLGGWSGIQYVHIENSTATHVETALSEGAGCVPGAMCSYACPPGYQKSQWPSSQGAAGQSIGGLGCSKARKLTLTNPDLSTKLCVPGTGAALFRNDLEARVAVCRTDYPGTENQVVPVEVDAGAESPLTCPDSRTYFRYRGAPTTAQYYLNNMGLTAEEACRWGEDGSNVGNWAPSVLGLGQDDQGSTWLSIAANTGNRPRNYSPLNYTVTIIGNLSDTCRLQNGRYCSGMDYQVCDLIGCTVQLLSGQATYVAS